MKTNCDAFTGGTASKQCLALDEAGGILCAHRIQMSGLPNAVSGSCPVSDQIKLPGGSTPDMNTVCEAVSATLDLTAVVNGGGSQNVATGATLTDNTQYMLGVCKHTSGAAVCEAKSCADFGDSNSGDCPSGFEAPNGETCVWTG